MQATYIDSSNVLPKQWEKAADYYTSDEVINAYLQGRKDQRSDNQQVLLYHLNENVRRVTIIVESLYTQICSSHGIKVKSIHLNIANVKQFTALFTVDSKDFLSEHFRCVYELARQLKKDNNSDTFAITFMFMPDGKELDKEALHSDGFIFKYAKAGKEPSPCSA